MIVKKRFEVERLGPVLLVISVLLVWEGLVRQGSVSPLFFPAPTTIAKTLATWGISGELKLHLAVTVARLGIGGILGGSIGLVLGLLIGWSRRICLLIDPLIAAVHPIPKIAILPLVMILFGIGETSKIVLIAVGVFFPMVINTAAGVRQIDPLYFDVAHNYGITGVKVFWRVVIPGSLPMILTGMRLAVNIALLLTIAVELVTAQQGLGAIIWLAWETLRTEELYASLVVIALLGISMNIGLHLLRTYLVPWQAER
ncbi:ABC transporter permease subunit [candidate division KSB3 bacterium]|uniref:ABC transporter permease subunit n=1 Tax=candidate division KSB3 bacterium TaxID=2044937 RepID=A0A9D5JSK1_9BACT|nr:ABC transporter permease subunit [candidate division KSB3 bacterium]MBD3323254.1 ABC transporter permease subunit [candidate division KSB3 bacterium]